MFAAYAIAWISTAAAVITAVNVSGKCWPLWFMVIPLFISISSRRSDDE